MVFANNGIAYVSTVMKEGLYSLSRMLLKESSFNGI